MEEAITCKFTGYLVTGNVFITDWYDGNGTIQMTSKIVSNEEDIISAINDAGFGCKDMIAADLYIYKMYEHGAKIFWKEETINLKEPGKPLSEKIEKAFYEDYEPNMAEA